jgi:two-component system, OmpR family, catabolic regulation response regulator CreB
MKPHILIIEDEPAIAETLLYACNEVGMLTTYCTLGQVGIQTLKTQAIDFVVLDVGLPDMSGFDVCKQLRVFSSVPILFLTARNHEIDRIVGLEIGADDYVTKPFSPREVVARIGAILRRGHHTHTNPSRAEFEIDEMQRRIQFLGHYLTLTRYEFLLLRVLVTSPKRVYSRDQLMDLVWVDADETLERTVDAHIKTLRRKLRSIDPNTHAIITHRGMGYSLYA